DRKSTRLNSSHVKISYAVFCLKKKIFHLPGFMPLPKNMQPFNWLSLIFFVLLVECERPLPTFDSVNLDVWKTDSQGCTGKRSKLESNIREEKDKLLGLNEKQVIRLL